MRDNRSELKLNAGAGDVAASQAWPDYSRLRNSHDQATPDYVAARFSTELTQCFVYLSKAFRTPRTSKLAKMDCRWFSNSMLLCIALVFSISVEGYFGCHGDTGKCLLYCSSIV